MLLAPARGQMSWRRQTLAALSMHRVNGHDRSRTMHMRWRRQHARRQRGILQVQIMAQSCATPEHELLLFDYVD